MANCKAHYCDNQGLCHRCGILIEPEWYANYLGITLEELEEQCNADNSATTAQTATPKAARTRSARRRATGTDRRG